MSRISFLSQSPPYAWWEAFPPIFFCLSSTHSLPIFKHLKVVFFSLQCKNRCSLFSASSPHNRPLEQIYKPLRCRASWVKQALLITNHVKQETLWGILTFHMSSRPQFCQGGDMRFQLADLNEYFPLLQNSQTWLSLPVVVSLKGFRSCNMLETVSIS